jgi:hypothetical protein
MGLGSSRRARRRGRATPVVEADKLEHALPAHEPNPQTRRLEEPADQHIFDFLAAEYRAKGDDARQFLLTGERMLALTGPLLAAIIAGAFTAGVIGILMIAPVLSSLIVLFLLRLWREVLALGGYRQFLEEELSDLAGRTLGLWETDVAGPVIHRRGTAYTTNSVLVLPFLGSLAVGAYAAWHLDAQPGTIAHLPIYYSAGCAALGFVLLLSLGATVGIRAETYRLLRARYPRHRHES